MKIMTKGQGIFTEVNVAGVYMIEIQSACGPQRTKVEEKRPDLY
jgi:hypothetical protein